MLCILQPKSNGPWVVAKNIKGFLYMVNNKNQTCNEDENRNENSVWIFKMWLDVQYFVYDFSDCFQLTIIKMRTTVWKITHRNENTGNFNKDKQQNELWIHQSWIAEVEQEKKKSKFTSGVYGCFSFWYCSFLWTFDMYLFCSLPPIFFFTLHAKMVTKLQFHCSMWKLFLLSFTSLAFFWS